MGKQQKKYRKEIASYYTYTRDDRAYLIETLVIASLDPIFFADSLFQNYYTILIEHQNWFLRELEKLEAEEKISKKKWHLLKEAYQLQIEMLQCLSDYVDLNLILPDKYVEQKIENSELDYANYVDLLNKKVKKYQKRKEEEKIE